MIIEYPQQDRPCILLLLLSLACGPAAAQIERVNLAGDSNEVRDIFRAANPFWSAP